jgi:hypothetical protein
MGYNKLIIIFWKYRIFDEKDLNSWIVKEKKKDGKRYLIIHKSYEVDALNKNNSSKIILFGSRYCKIYLNGSTETIFNTPIEDTVDTKDFIEVLDENYHKLLCDTRNVLLLFHKNDLKNENVKNIRNTFTNPNINIELYSFGINDPILYENIIDDAEYDPSVKKNALINKNGQQVFRNEIFDLVWKEFFIKQKIIQLIYILTPLHLSLQAFWGVSINRKCIDNYKGAIDFICFGNNEDEENEYISKVIAQRKNIKKAQENNEISENILRIFPNINSFFLADGTNCDYYAPLFDMAIYNGEKGVSDNYRGTDEKEKELYSMDSFFEVLKICEEELELKDNKLITDFIDGFGKEISKNREIKINNSRLLFDVDDFIYCLRNICALLSNTDNNALKDNKYIGYKGRNKNRIKNILNNEKLKEHNKLKNDNYNILVEELIEFGIGNSILLIAGIELISFELKKILDNSNK